MAASGGSSFPAASHFQPSEWVKLVLIVLVARFFTNLASREPTWKDIFKAIGFVALPMLLVLKQPDLGTALTYTPVLLVGLFLGGIDWRKGGILVLVMLVAVGVVWKSGKILKPYQKQRLTSFMNPDADPRGTGYQIRQSKIAVGDGGCFRPGRQPGNADAGRLPADPLYRFHLCRIQRRARLRGRDPCAPDILFNTDAFDSKRSDSRGPARIVPGDGRGGGV